MNLISPLKYASNQEEYSPPNKVKDLMGALGKMILK
jgi:hypothetical protein